MSSRARVYTREVKVGGKVRVKCGCAARVSVSGGGPTKMLTLVGDERCSTHNGNTYLPGSMTEEQHYPVVLLDGELEAGAVSRDYDLDSMLEQVVTGSQGPQPPLELLDNGAETKPPLTLVKTKESGTQLSLRSTRAGDVIQLACDCVHLVGSKASSAFGGARPTIGLPLMACKDHPTDNDWMTHYKCGTLLTPDTKVMIVGVLGKTK